MMLSFTATVNESNWLVVSFTISSVVVLYTITNRIYNPEKCVDPELLTQ